MTLPALPQYRRLLLEGPRRSGRTTELCRLALTYSNPDLPAIIITPDVGQVQHELRVLEKTMPSEPEFHDGVVDVLHVLQCPIGLTGKRYGFFGVDNYDYLSPDEQLRIRPDYVGANMIALVMDDAIMAEVPDWDAWDRQRFPMGPFFEEKL